MQRTIFLGVLLAASPALISCQNVTGLSDLEFAAEPVSPGQGGAAGDGGGSGEGGEGGAAGIAGAGGSEAGAGGDSGAGGSEPAGAGGEAGGGPGGAAGAGGGCDGGNQAPVAVVPASVEGSAGQEIVLDASGSSDPEQGSLTFAWEPLSGAPELLQASGAQATALVQECGEYSYRVVVTDGCGATGEATVKVAVKSGAYVAKNACNPATACGGKSSPWCEIQEAIDTSKGALVVRAASGVYGPVTLREGVSIEGGYDDQFVARSTIPGEEKTVLSMVSGSALRGPPQGSSFVDGVLVLSKLTAPQAKLAAILLQQQGALTLRNARVDGGEGGQTVVKFCGVQREVGASGALVLEEGVEINGLNAAESSAAVCLEGTGDVSLTGATLRGGTAASSFAVDAAFVGLLGISGSTLIGGSGVERSVALRWILASPEPGARLQLDGSIVRAGKGAETAGLKLERIGEAKIKGGEIHGEDANPGGTQGTRGVGLWAIEVGEGATPGVSIEDASVEGASFALERVGVLVDRTGLKLSGGTVDGTDSAGGRRAVGVRSEGLAAGPGGISIQKTIRIRGGAPSGVGMKYEAYGIELVSPTGATISENKQILGCSPACKADAPDSAAAGVKVTQGVHKIDKNDEIAGGAQAGGAAVATARHAGLQLSVGCGEAGCVSVSAAGNALIAGNRDGLQPPGYALGVESKGVPLSLQDNLEVVGGHGFTQAVGVSAEGSKGSVISRNVIGGGAAKVAVGARTSSQEAQLFLANVVNACGILDTDACKITEQSTGLVSHNDKNSRFANNYVVGGFGAIATGCELGNSAAMLAGEGAAQFVYNLCFGVGRAKTTEPTTEAVGVRLVGLDGQKAQGLLLLNNIFLVTSVTAERFGGVEGPVEQLIMRNNDFFLLSGPQGLGPGSAYYKRGAVEIDDLPTLNQSTSSVTFTKNISVDPKFKAPLGDFSKLSAAGLHLNTDCALLNQGLVTPAEANDFDGEIRGKGGADGLPEIGPDECP